MLLSGYCQWSINRSTGLLKNESFQGRCVYHKKTVSSNLLSSFYSKPIPFCINFLPMLISKRYFSEIKILLQFPEELFFRKTHCGCFYILLILLPTGKNRQRTICICFDFWKMDGGWFWGKGVFLKSRMVGERSGYFEKP